MFYRLELGLVAITKAMKPIQLNTNVTNTHIAFSTPLDRLELATTMAGKNTIISMINTIRICQIDMPIYILH